VRVFHTIERVEGTYIVPVWRVCAYQPAVMDHWLRESWRAIRVGGAAQNDDARWYVAPWNARPRSKLRGSSSQRVATKREANNQVLGDAS
jgi:hypothetical protein